MQGTHKGTLQGILKGALTGLYLLRRALRFRRLEGQGRDKAGQEQYDRVVVSGFFDTLL